MNINDRIIEIINNIEGGKRIAFAKKINRKSNQISNIIKKDASVGNIIIQDILKAYPEINANWLINGEGEMLKNNDKNDKEIDNKEEYIDIIKNLTQQNKLLTELLSEKIKRG